MDSYVFAERIVSQIDDLEISRVVLFGSSVDGEVTDDSDLDLAIIFRDPERGAVFDRRAAKLEIRRRIHDINLQVAIDLVVYTESEYAALSQQPSFVRSEIVHRGRTVYEKAG